MSMLMETTTLLLQRHECAFRHCSRRLCRGTCACASVVTLPKAWHQDKLQDQDNSRRLPFNQALQHSGGLEIWVLNIWLSPRTPKRLLSFQKCDHNRKKENKKQYKWMAILSYDVLFLLVKHDFLSWILFGSASTSHTGDCTRKLATWSQNPAAYRSELRYLITLDDLAEIGLNRCGWKVGSRIPAFSRWDALMRAFDARLTKWGSTMSKAVALQDPLLSFPSRLVRYRPRIFLRKQWIRTKSPSG